MKKLHASVMLKRGDSPLVRRVAGLALAAALFCAASVWPVVARDALTDSQARLLADLKYLASDELEGRGVGLKGLDLAAEYIRTQLERAGLRLNAVGGTAYQSFRMTTGARPGKINNLELIGPDGAKLALTAGSDFATQSFGGSGAFMGELVFCGYGIDAPDKNYNDFAGIDLRGKVALVMRKVPQQSHPQGNFLTAHGGVSSHADLRNKLSNAAAKGAVAVLFVNDPHSGRTELEQGKRQVGRLAEAAADAAVEFEAADPQNAGQLAAARKKLSEEVAKYRSGKAHLGAAEPDTLMRMGHVSNEAVRDVPVIHVTRAVCDRVLKPALGKTLAELEAEIDRDFKPRSALLTGWTAAGVATVERQQADVKNVIAVLDGAGPTADETIVVGAHYDHVGRGGSGSLAPGSSEVHNGADDNASGTICLIEVARRLAARGEKLRRRVVFAAFTAEETGLVGSARYTNDPPFALDKTIAMINMDMVGRLKDNKLTVFGVGSSSTWEPLLTRFGKELSFDMVFKPEGLGPSDHQSFFVKKIPVLHLFTGNHPDYHRPTDDWEKVNVEGTRRVADLVEKLVVELAMSPERPEYIAVAGTAQIAQRDGARPYFGSIPDFGSDQPGYSLAGVGAGSPAQKAGLMAGDRIVQIGPHPVKNLEDFDLALRRFSPGETVDVMIARGPEKLTLKVTLEKPRG
jgi:hypothetical protein